MRQIIILIIIAIGIISCDKENENIDYKISFTLSKSEVVAVDTIILLMDWNNSKITDEVLVSAYDINTLENVFPVPIHGLTLENNLIITIPIGLSFNSEIEVKHPNGASARQYLYKKYSPIITEISPLTGKGGDIITIKGHEFLSGKNLKVMINSMTCETVEISDSVLKVEVPQGCGSGRIVINGFLSDIYPLQDFIDNSRVFGYLWEETETKKLISIDKDGIVLYFHRDNNGNIYKRTNSLYPDHVDYYSYNSQGLVDTVLSQGSYTLIERNTDNSTITASRFKNDKSFISRTEIVIYQGNISLLEYKEHSESYFTHYTKQYRYVLDSLTITKTYYDEGLNVTSVIDDSYLVDNYNSHILDLDIPGYHSFLDFWFDNNFEYPVISPRYNVSLVTYNKSGQLTKWETPILSPGGMSEKKYSLTYE